ALRNAGLGHPILVAREGVVKEVLKTLGLEGSNNLEIANAKVSPNVKLYIDQLYTRNQRKGLLLRDCQRRINQNRNIFAAMMVCNGDADVMITGLTRTYHHSFEEIRQVVGPAPDQIVFAVSILLVRGRTVLLADTAVNEKPDPEQLAHIAIQSAAMARRMGQEPRVAFVSHSTFGNPLNVVNERIRSAVQALERQEPDFEFDGEMTVDVALDADLLEHYPFCRLSAPANVLIMPTMRSASIAAKITQKLAGATVMGPILVGMSREVQIVSMESTVSDIVNMAVMGCYEAIKTKKA
ncbi:MAG: NADP-dependent malic enzyme, partial [Alphaproteobacteria bacterium]|nr:NADP-dependent malic enzyme [Alphaproteobacteria bacterium]